MNYKLLSMPISQADSLVPKLDNAVFILIEGSGEVQPARDSVKASIDTLSGVSKALFWTSVVTTPVAFFVAPYLVPPLLAGISGTGATVSGLDAIRSARDGNYAGAVAASLNVGAVFLPGSVVGTAALGSSISRLFIKDAAGSTLGSRKQLAVAAVSGVAYAVAQSLLPAGFVETADRVRRALTPEDFSPVLGCSEALGQCNPVPSSSIAACAVTATRAAEVAMAGVSSGVVSTAILTQARTAAESSLDLSAIWLRNATSAANATLGSVVADFPVEQAVFESAVNGTLADVFTGIVNVTVGGAEQLLPEVATDISIWAQLSRALTGASGDGGELGGLLGEISALHTICTNAAENQAQLDQCAVLQTLRTAVQTEQNTLMSQLAASFSEVKHVISDLPSDVSTEIASGFSSIAETLNSGLNSFFTFFSQPEITAEGVDSFLEKFGQFKDLLVEQSNLLTQAVTAFQSPSGAIAEGQAQIQAACQKRDEAQSCVQDLKTAVEDLTSDNSADQKELDRNIGLFWGGTALSISMTLFSWLSSAMVNLIHLNNSKKYADKDQICMSHVQQFVTIFSAAVRDDNASLNQFLLPVQAVPRRSGPPVPPPRKGSSLPAVPEAVAAAPAPGQSTAWSAQEDSFDISTLKVSASKLTRIVPLIMDLIRYFTVIRSNPDISEIMVGLVRDYSTQLLNTLKVYPKTNVMDLNKKINYATQMFEVLCKDVDKFKLSDIQTLTQFETNYVSEPTRPRNRAHSIAHFVQPLGSGSGQQQLELNLSEEDAAVVSAGLRKDADEIYANIGAYARRGVRRPGSQYSQGSRVQSQIDESEM